jgi:hypothetical protein
LVKTDAEATERIGHPQITADGAFLLFVVSDPNKSWESGQIVALRLATGERKVLVSGGTAPHLTKSGHLVFFRDSTLFAQAFDERTGSVSGTAVPMVQKTASAPFSGNAQFAVSDTGTLVYVEGAGDDVFTLTWLDRAGKAEPITAAPKRRYYEPRLSPDGTMVATATRDDSPDIYVWDLRRNTETRVTRDEARDVAPIWLDNRELLFGTEVNGELALARRRVDLTTERTIVAKPKASIAPIALSSDGKTVIVGSFPSGLSVLARLSLEQPGTPELMFGSSAPSPNAAFSPDGKWIAYEAREGERTEIYVRPYPNINDRRFQISQGGGIWPAWSRNGRELFYVAGVGGNNSRMLVAVPIKPPIGTTFDWAPGKPLFNCTPYVRGGSRSYDVSLDGAKFLVIASGDTASAGPSRTVMRYVTNWFEELRAKVK